MKILIGVVLLCFLAALFHERWLLRIGDFLIVEDTLQPADVIHIIAGEDYRTDYAIQLYKQGYGKMLFFTGGWWEKYQYFNGEHGCQRSLAAGIPLDAIAIDDSEVISTYMEAELLKDWISHRSSPIRSVIVISDPFHMRRARWTYEKVFDGSIEIQMAPVPFEQTPYKRTWWRDTESQRYVREEYQKYIYYILRYQISRGRFQEWLISLDRN